MTCGANCGHSADDPEHILPSQGTQDLLYSKIDLNRVEALNAEHQTAGRDVIKPWDQRLDESMYVRSDSDEQLIIRIPFTGQVKLRAIIIKGERGESCPKRVRIFTNVPDIDFDTAETEKPAQDLDLIESPDPVEYPLPATRYPAVTNITLFFDQNAGGETTQIYFIGFRGEFSKRVDRPGQIIYEAIANPADHVKLPGMGYDMQNSLGSR